MSEDPVAKLGRSIAIRSPLVRNLLSEFFGTLMLLFIGLTIVMQFILTGEKLNTWININLGWGFAITFCVLMTSKTSGGHLNPAVSLLMVTLGRLPFVHFILYTIVQTVGAFVGALFAYLIYADQFAKAQLNDVLFIKCFCSMSDDHVSHLTSFFDQVVGTAFLCLFVCAVIDKKNKVPDFLHPLFFGLILIMIGCSMGLNLGYPINPARDFGPRLFTIFFKGAKAFTLRKFYFWIPAVAPLLGAVLGGWSYFIFVGVHIDAEDEKAQHVVVLEDGKHEHKSLLKNSN